ncbi:MAG: glucans biosynthesis glucosyltransferase MdoH [Verrucomicrobia bacterium]|nr:MAG: glucans biosynthesis glucosyltransferase MdoH [Verrucomicrobiota bacterium]
MPTENPNQTPGPSLRLEQVTPVPPHLGRRLFYFYSGAVLLTGLVSMLFADLLWRTGWSASRTVLLILFVILFFLMAVGCMHGVVGFILRRIGDKRRITALKDFKSCDLAGSSTAIVFPIYNEDVLRVCEGLRASYESLRQTGQLERFDFFILSDSTNPDKWVEEERRWQQLVTELNALGRIYYRRRILNEGKKSGNIRDFLRSWGRRYRYFIVFDADSIMRGETLVDLVKLMETHPDVGLIQTVPGLVNAESLFGRIQQFANRLYAGVFISGLNYWAQNFGNYWGHNAIIRTEPFMLYCDLPQLPGRKPFGGHILSHDFVEAALMLKNNWQVWMAHDLEGSYEEGPQGMIENAQRDRRWCQGNLQHGMVVLAQGLRGISRIHLTLGIFGYLSSPLWFAFLVTFNYMRWTYRQTGLSDLATPSFNPYLAGVSATAHAFLVFIICMSVIFLPKILALVDLAFAGDRRRSFGGLTRAVASAIAETIFSTLHAPLQMLWHTAFVITILLGRGVNWGTQVRAADGTSWLYALSRHWGHTLIGLLWGFAVFKFDRASFWWFLPVVSGMVLSIPVSVLTSRSALGHRARQLGLFLTPEEVQPPREIASLRLRLAAHELSGESAPRRLHAGLADAVLDPYVNAIHVSLLREKQLNPVYAEALAAFRGGSVQSRVLGERLLLEGPEKLQPQERLFVLTDPDTMAWLHWQAWVRPPESLSDWWVRSIRRYAR